MFWEGKGKTHTQYKEQINVSTGIYVNNPFIVLLPIKALKKKSTHNIYKSRYKFYLPKCPTADN